MERWIDFQIVHAVFFPLWVSPVYVIWAMWLRTMIGNNNQQHLSKAHYMPETINFTYLFHVSYWFYIWGTKSWETWIRLTKMMHLLELELRTVWFLRPYSWWLNSVSTNPIAFLHSFLKEKFTSSCERKLTWDKHCHPLLNKVEGNSILSKIWLQTAFLASFPTLSIYRFHIHTTLLTLPMIWPPLP